MAVIVVTFVELQGSDGVGLSFQLLRRMFWKLGLTAREDTLGK
jgi:hypothetical protein